jgi:hypothetical protein
MKRTFVLLSSKRTLLLLSIAALLVQLLPGCSTLNGYGIGGEPVLMCKHRDSTAHIDDKVAGPSDVHASVVRRFRDADSLCAKPATPAASSIQ